MEEVLAMERRECEVKLMTSRINGAFVFRRSGKKVGWMEKECLKVDFLNVVLMKFDNLIINRIYGI